METSPMQAMIIQAATLKLMAKRYNAGTRQNVQAALQGAGKALRAWDACSLRMKNITEKRSSLWHGGQPHGCALRTAAEFEADRSVRTVRKISRQGQSRIAAAFPGIL